MDSQEWLLLPPIYPRGLTGCQRQCHTAARKTTGAAFLYHHRGQGGASHLSACSLWGIRGCTTPAKSWGSRT